MKTSELTGAALDWAVCKAAGLIDAYPSHKKRGFFLKAWGTQKGGPLHPSTDWSQGGPLVERERLHICPIVDTYMKGDSWAAWVDLLPQFENRSVGPTPLIAAMRAFVASKLGDEVDIPKELL